jgi:glycosyltransferase involved in cell wall biosynthesis
MRRDQKKRVVFVTTPNSDPWAGSEELWSRTALDLVSRGIPVSASVTKFAPLHARMLELQAHGVELWLREDWYSLHRHPWRRLMSLRKGPNVFDVGRLLAARPPALAVLSHGGGRSLPNVELLELCASQNVPFVTIGQLNHDFGWPDDEVARRYRDATRAALRCFFVSRANQRMTEKQIGVELANAEVVWNPVNVSSDATPSWPPLGSAGELRLACVARLYPPGKGQDVLFEALAGPPWAGRAWKLYLYGEGQMREGLQRLAARLGLADRVVFAGFRSVEEIWSANHVLVMPSRFEGLPLAMVEAMLCARPVVATDVAGHAEIIEDGVTGFLAEAPTVGSISAALERFWDRRHEAEDIGKAGSRKIRALLPADPVGVFSGKLRRLAGLD